jgi:hypothetical protein
MKKRYRVISLLFVLTAFTSCEGEGEPFTLEELYELNGFPTKRFELNLNESVFETDLASGVKSNTALAIEASGAGVNYILSVSGLEEGTYLGAVNDSKVFLNYEDASGKLFSSTKPGVKSNFVVEVSKINAERRVVSGNFNGTLYELNGDLKLSVTNGSFLEVMVTQPAFGEMTAKIDNRSFVADSCYFTSNTSGGFTFDTFLGVGNEDSASINITVQEKIQEREYQMSSGAITTTYNSNTFTGNVFKNQYDADAGSLTVVEIDTVNNVISGRFNFTVRNAFGEPLEISEGEFFALIR